MKVVKISEAKAHLSRHLEFVRSGGRVRIMDRDVPVADIVPVERARRVDEHDDEALLQSLERRGLLRRGKRGVLPRELFRPGPRDPEGAVLSALLEERRDGR